MAEHLKGYVLYRYDDSGLDGEFDSMIDDIVVIRSDHKIEDFTDEDQKLSRIVYSFSVRDAKDLVDRLKKEGYDAFIMRYSTVELAS